MITLHLFYTGENGNARKFADEMESSGLADAPLMNTMHPP